MKKLFILILCLSLGYTSLRSQITTSKITTKANAPKSNDSLENFLGSNVNLYIGQELYLKGRNEKLQKFGYDGFFRDYKKTDATDGSSIYKGERDESGLILHSSYKELSGKYFKVLAVLKHPEAERAPELYGREFFFKLQEKESGDILYYEYDTSFEFNFPFVMVGYFTKIKQLYIDHQYVIGGVNWYSSHFNDADTTPVSEMTTGAPVSNFCTGAMWKCTDLTIDEKYYAIVLVLQNTKGEKIPLPLDDLHKGYAYEAKLASLYEAKFGHENWRAILKRSVKIGMTKEMCRMAWGEPKSINETVNSNGKSEQWVYPSNNYLYFNQNILSSVQR